MEGFLEVIETEVWKRIYDEGWRMWKEGLDRLRKSDNGLEAAKAKQLMDDAERILRVPTRIPISPSEGRGEDRERYKKGLAAREEKIVREEFESKIKGE